jgi:hypothetical protein
VHDADAGKAWSPPLEWPGGWLCHPKAFPALETLSSTDVGKSDPQWECVELNVEDLLVEGEHLTYEIARTLRWLVEG